ncbi:MAG: YjbE family putative metal transport protein [Ktedonobacteraceae bacterium]|nr:YjbE family putative metal transport protein [Ktedonobacteraceae bacterium]
MFEWLGAIGSIILVDLVLSGDNALVIGAAASGLARRQRLWAIIFGGGGAIVLRILFTVIATLLLQLPLLQAIGGIVLIYIAIHLLVDRSKERRSKAEQIEKGETRGPTGKPAQFFPALLTILVADVTMSLDNVLAVGAIAAGELPLLAIGLLLSIGLLLAGSALIAELIRHLPWLLDVASLVLAWTASNMLLEDDRLNPILAQLPGFTVIVPAMVLVMVMLVDLWLWRRDRRLVQKVSLVQHSQVGRGK